MFFPHLIFQDTSSVKEVNRLNKVNQTHQGLWQPLGKTLLRDMFTCRKVGLELGLLLYIMATLRENPGLKVKLLVGPTTVKSHHQLKGAVQGIFGDHLRCAMKTCYPESPSNKPNLAIPLVGLAGCDK